jgi:hypothetical protein
MSTFQIKIIGNKADIMTATKEMETVFGISRIKRMSGVMLNKNMGHYHRFIEVFSETASAKIKDNNGNIIKGFFFGKKKGALS